MILLELCNGDLKELFLSERKNLDPKQLAGDSLKLKLQALKEIAAGCNFIHSNDFVHFDIKCGNILFTKSIDKYKFKISDFGVFKDMPRKFLYNPLLVFKNDSLCFPAK